MISIIVPIYKVEKYLSRCIESIKAQNYKDIEIILVDDGSPDKCGEICDKYAMNDQRIVVIHQKNSGVSSARNAGLNIAKGQYIGFVDPDDWVAPDMYKGMIEALEMSGVDLAICGYDYYDESGHVEQNRRYLIRENEVITQKEVMRRFSDMPPSIRHSVCNKLFKKNLLRTMKYKIGLHSSEDVFFLNEYVQKINSAIVVHKPYYKNLVRNGSATHGGLNVDSLADSFSAHNKMYCDTVNMYPDLQNHSLAFLLDVCALKYNEAKRKTTNLSEEEKREVKMRLNEMRQYIKKHAWQALLNKEIYWKTRLYYLIIK